MLKSLRILAATAILAVSAPAFAADPENTLVITLKDGDVTVALSPQLAPSMSSRSRRLPARVFMMAWFSIA